MTEIKLKWYLFKEKELDEESEILNLEKAIYMYVCAEWNSEKKQWLVNSLPFYIGQVYERPVMDRLKEHLEDEIRNCMNAKCKNTILIKVAKIEPINMERITQDLVDDIECCLIFKSQPKCNEKCKESYSGKDLKILNNGKRLPLEEEYVCGE